MLNASNIILICWLIFLLYWMVHWRSVKPAKETTWRSPGFRWTFLWIIILIILVSRFLLPLLGIHSLTSSATPITTLQIIGIAVTIIGLIIAIVARKTLADNWSSDIELKVDHKLITTGIYRYVRHPIYTGITSMGVGTIITLQSFLPAFFYIGMIAFFIFKMKKEETLLIKHFPKEYPAYMKRTKALIPFLY